MRAGNPRAGGRHWIALGLVLALLTFAGCRQGRVTPIPGREVIALAADDIARMMKLAGFTDQQVIDMGPDVRNSLAASGAVQVEMKGKVEAIFAVEGPYIHVITRGRGNFIYDVDKNRPR